MYWIHTTYSVIFIWLSTSNLPVNLLLIMNVPATSHKPVIDLECAGSIFPRRNRQLGFQCRKLNALPISTFYLYVQVEFFILFYMFAGIVGWWMMW
jgi:hypothetical protein